MRGGQRAFEHRDWNFKFGGGLMFKPPRSKDRGSFHHGRNIELIETEFGQPCAFGDVLRGAWIVAVVAEPVLKRTRKNSGRKQQDTEE